MKGAEAFAGFHIKLPTKLLPGDTLDYFRVTQEGLSRSVYISYDHNLGIKETIHSQETLDTIYNQDHEAHEKGTVRDQPGLFLQGFWGDGKFIRMENGGGGTILLWWFEDGIDYSIGAMNERGFTKELWLAIAESMK